MSRLGANTRSRLGAYVKSPLGARGQLNGFDFRIGWLRVGTELSFDLGLRLNQLLSERRSTAINSLNIFQTLPHPPKYPKDYPTFSGKAELSVKDEVGNTCLVNGQDKIEIELDHVDGILRSAIDRYTIAYNWQDFQDPAGTAATNPSYDKAANYAKPVAKTYTITLKLLSATGKELIIGSFQTGFAPPIYIWNKYESTVGVAAIADGSAAGRRLFQPPDDSATMQVAYAGNAEGALLAFYGSHTVIYAISGEIKGYANAQVYNVATGQFYTINPDADSSYYASLMDEVIPFESWGNRRIQTAITPPATWESYWIFVDEEGHTTVVPLQNIQHAWAYHYDRMTGFFRPTTQLPARTVDEHVLDDHIAASLAQTMAVAQLWIPFFASATPPYPITVTGGGTEYVVQGG